MSIKISNKFIRNIFASFVASEDFDFTSSTVFGPGLVAFECIKGITFSFHRYYYSESCIVIYEHYPISCLNLTVITLSVQTGTAIVSKLSTQQLLSSPYSRKAGVFGHVVARNT